MKRKNSKKTFQDKYPNFRGKSGTLYLVRCFKCDPKYGRENHAAAVATGQCAWCGWSEHSHSIQSMASICEVYDENAKY